MALIAMAFPPRRPSSEVIKTRDLPILDAVSKRLEGESSEDDGLDGADSSAGQESGNSVPGHEHVNGDGVALFDSHSLQDVSHAANFAEKLSVGDFAAFARLIDFVDDCGLLKSVSS
jgi:hypothetical protein